MAIETAIIEGVKVELYDRPLGSFTRYVVYNEKLWAVFSQSGMGNSRSIGLEREGHKETTWLKGDQIKELKYVINSTGYIRI